MTIYHANWVSNETTISFLWFNYEGDLNLIKNYRQQRQSGSQGSESIETYEMSRDIKSNAGVAFADFATLKALEGETGTLTIRGQAVTNCRLKTAFKMRGVNPSSTVTADNITTTYTHLDLTVTFTKES